MFARRLQLFLWILLYLSSLEIALEFRAYRRGWQTPLFGADSASSKAAPPVGGGKLYGPTQDFPFRSEIVTPKGTQGSRRYWIASASYAEDASLPPDKVFPNRLQALLEAGGDEVQVLNASFAGMGILANAKMLAERGPKWRPDYAILYQMSLDINSLSEHLLGSGGAERTPLPKVDSVEDSGPPRSSWTVRLVESTTTYAILKANVTAWLTSTRVLADELPQSAQPIFEARVRRFILDARSSGATPVLCTFATSHGRGDLGQFPPHVVTFLFRYNPYLSLLGWVKTVERLNEVLSRVAHEEQLLLIDVASALNSRPKLFRDFVHLTPEGHAVVAETMAAALASRAGQEPFDPEDE